MSTTTKRAQSPSVPPRLRSWQPWLAKLMPATSKFLAQSGQLLRPLIQAACTPTLLERTQPIGVGGLSRRGDFSRLSMSDWLWAEAEPLEFLRRAAMHELLFLAPEPERVPNKPELVLLFDTGPLQVGAPRLAHLALWVALARRAETLGATLYWGSAQQLLTTGATQRAEEHKLALSTRTDATALDLLAAARSPKILGPADMDPIATLLAPHAGAEFWWIGATASAGLLEQLPVVLRQRFRVLAISETLGNVRTLLVRQARDCVVLPLPPAQAAVEILRQPSKLRDEEDAKADSSGDAKLVQLGCGAFTLQQPLLFSTNSETLALGTFTGPVLIHATKTAVQASELVPSWAQELEQPAQAWQHQLKQRVLKVIQTHGETLALDLVGGRASRVERWGPGFVGFREFGPASGSLPAFSVAVEQLPGQFVSSSLGRWHKMICDRNWAYFHCSGKLLVAKPERGSAKDHSVTMRELTDQVKFLERSNGQVYAVLAGPGRSALSIRPLVNGALSTPMVLEGAVDRPFQLPSGDFLYQHAQGHWLRGSATGGWQTLPWRLKSKAHAIGIALRGGKNPQLCVLDGDYFYFLPLNPNSADATLADIKAFGQVQQAAISDNGARLAWLTVDRQLRIYSLSQRRCMLRCSGKREQLPALPGNSR